MLLQGTDFFHDIVKLQFQKIAIIFSITIVWTPNRWLGQILQDLDSGKAVDFFFFLKSEKYALLIIHEAP